jgi:ABC-type lipoprotein export system ATPase subunit
MADNSPTKVEIAPKDCILRSVDLYRTFKVGDRSIEVLRGISVQIMRGEVVFLVGPSGAGKSTLMYTLAGLERPEKGRVYLNHDDIYKLPANQLSRVRNQHMGFVFQSYHLLPELTAVENVALPSLIGGRPARQKAEDLLAELGLKERLHHLPMELSGGEQQRVAIARSLINDPKIIFADEPTGNLDSRNGGLIMEVLMREVRKKERTMVVVTHDRNLAQTGDRMLEIVDGRVQD